MPDMTPEQEAKFFETGELPPELATQVAAPIEEQAPPVVTPPAQPPVAQPPAQTTDPYTTLQRQLIEAEARRAATEQQLTDLVTQLQALQSTSQEAEVPDPNT